MNSEFSALAYNQRTLFGDLANNLPSNSNLSYYVNTMYGSLPSSDFDLRNPSDFRIPDYQGFSPSMENQRITHARNVGTQPAMAEKSINDLQEIPLGQLQPEEDEYVFKAPVETSEISSIEDATVNSAEEGFSEGGVLGMAAGVISGLAADQQTKVDVARDQRGEGYAGNSFATGLQAASDTAHDQRVGMEDLGMIAAGSLFGPEGVVVGLAGAAANSLLNTNSPTTVTSNIGTDVPVTNIT